MNSDRVLDVKKLPPIGYYNNAPLWWGQVGMVAIEGTIFALLIATYFYLRMNVPVWPPPGSELNRPVLPTIGLVILLLSVYPTYVASEAVVKGEWLTAKIGMVLNILCALLFLILRIVEWRSLNFRWDTNAYGSIVWTILGLHSSHVFASMVESSFLTFFLFKGRMGEKQRLGIRVDSVYWYFVVGAWIPLYLVLYVAPYFL
jgi:cytochrome c oxidase subunit III